MKTTLTILLMTLAQAGMAAECSKISPPYKNTLVELFTSDGCNSCPPANKWLSELVRDKPANVIPLSMHVTYWNHLGWTDRFSDKIFDQRQMAYARTAISKFSYTPEVFAGGKEWRGWGTQRALADVVTGNAKATAQVKIELRAERPRSDELNVAINLAPLANTGGSGQLYLALYQDNLSTDIRAGENKGSVLRHDHVVRRWVGPIPFSGAGLLHKQTFALDKQWNPALMGIVAIAQGAAEREVLQALDLPLCST